MNKEIINGFFKPSAIKSYDFSKTNIVYSRQIKELSKPFKNYNAWCVYQFIYLVWNKWSVFINSFNKNGQKNFEKNFNETLRVLFLENGYMEGNTLDLGGGCGSLMAYWRGSGQYRYFNQDPNVITYEYCLEENDTVIFVEGYAENLPYKNQVFDTVLIADALDHFADHERALQECNRILKPDGILLIVHSFRNEKYTKSFVKKIHTKLMLSLNKKIHSNTFINKDIITYLRSIGFDRFRKIDKLVKNSCIAISVIRARKKEVLS